MPRRLPLLPPPSPEPLGKRVAIGLHKLGLAMKQQGWHLASKDGLSPTQGHILSLLATTGAATASAIATELGVSLPTVSDSVRALVDKGLVAKAPDPRHPRASLLSPTDAGADLAQRIGGWPDFLAAAVDELTPAEQSAMLSGVVKMIRTLQERGLVSTARMCATCTYFRPYAHEGELPHHCAYVDAPMRADDLRIECREYEEAPPEARAANWQRFLNA